MFINHKMTHRYIYFMIHKTCITITSCNNVELPTCYKRLCCQNLANRQTEMKWSFFVEHLNLWFAGTHENWYTMNKNEFTVYI